jgi:hypothetical protein
MLQPAAVAADGAMEVDGASSEDALSKIQAKSEELLKVY